MMQFLILNFFLVIYNVVPVLFSTADFNLFSWLFVSLLLHTLSSFIRLLHFLKRFLIVFDFFLKMFKLTWIVHHHCWHYLHFSVVQRILLNCFRISILIFLSTQINCYHFMASFDAIIILQTSCSILLILTSC